MFIGLFAVMYRGMTEVIKSITALIKRQRLDKANQIGRGVIEYRPSEIGGFFLPESLPTNVVISGGDNRRRSQTISAIAYAACVNNMPVVVLHEADRDLESMLQITFANSGRLTVINHNNPMYDPFIGLSDNEISKLIMEAAAKEFDIKPNAKYYIDGMNAYIRALNKAPSLNAFVKCPHSDLFNKVDGLVIGGVFDSAKGQDIKSRLMQGQSERYKLENCFQSLEAQFAGILSRKTSHDRKSITRTIEESDVIVVDITSNVNKLMLNVLIAQIRMAMGKGKYVSFIADELSTENSELFAGLIRMHNEHCKLTVCSRDVFAMCGGEEKIFHTIIGNSGKIVLYAHSSGAGATKWAEAIGYYDKMETSTAHSTGKYNQSPFKLFPGSNTTSTTNYNIKREFIIKPEEINRMRPGEVYIFDSLTQELAHTLLV
jgi:hypothetical protein